MITVEQIRAGRAMLDWSRAELAKAAGISLRSLHNIECGIGTPRLKSLQTIKAAMEQAHIEFVGGDTVALRREIFDMDKLEGNGAIEALCEDLIRSYRQGVRELLLCNSDEKKWLHYMSSDMAEAYHKALLRFKIVERVILEHGDNDILDFPTSYRWMPQQYYTQTCYAVYGHALAIISWGPPLRIALIRNKTIAEGYRRNFEFIWQQAEVPPFMKNSSRENGPPRLSEKEIRQKGPLKVIKGDASVAAKTKSAKN